MKKIFFLSFFIFIVLATAGCSNQANQVSDQSTKKDELTNTANASQDDSNNPVVTATEDNQVESSTDQESTDNECGSDQAQSANNKSCLVSNDENVETEPQNNQPTSEVKTTKPAVASQSDNTNNEVKKSKDKVQVFLFHNTQRCSTCIAIGRLAGETVNEFFQKELRDGQIEFREINIDLPENRDLAQKFQASGSALFINYIHDNQDTINEDTRVWRLTSDPDQFKSYLRAKLNDLLGK